MKTLSIIIPAYNEEQTIARILEKIEAVDLGGVGKEIIVVDDCSSDRTGEILKKFENKYKIIYQDKNSGKGAAVRRGFKEAGGDVAIIQDADLEYNPEEYGKLIKPILDGRADVVFGSRFIGGQDHRVLYFWHSLGNKFLTLLSNMFTNLNLTDMEVCYKVFSRSALDKIMPCLSANRFGIEPELTAMVAKYKFRIYEVGISYYGRTYEEGKKINWKDGWAAIYYILKSNLTKK